MLQGDGTYESNGGEVVSNFLTLKVHTLLLQDEKLLYITNKAQ